MILKVEHTVEQTYGQWWLSQHWARLVVSWENHFNLLAVYSTWVYSSLLLNTLVVLKCVLDNKWNLQFKIWITPLPKILANIFMVSKEEILYLKKALWSKIKYLYKSNWSGGDKSLTTSPLDCFKSHSYMPTGHWLEGDTSQNPTDCRCCGPITAGLIKGWLFFKVWPFHSFGFLHNCLVVTDFSDVTVSYSSEFITAVEIMEIHGCATEATDRAICWGDPLVQCMKVVLVLFKCWFLNSREPGAGQALEMLLYGSSLASVFHKYKPSSPSDWLNKEWQPVAEKVREGGTSRPRKELWGRIRHRDLPVWQGDGKNGC